MGEVILQSACLDDLRAATEGHAGEAADTDAVDGMPARWVALPGSAQETAAVMRVATEHDLAVVVRGSGTKLSWGAPPERVDLVVDTSRMDTVVEHAAGDLIVVVGAGRRLADLQQDLAGSGQRLGVDPPRGGTVGGLIATAATGPTRLLYGPVRDLVIGVTFVRADGVVAHAGGKVVKNVAGYDIGKLLAGSLGTLGVITQAAFRLHPLPKARTWLSIPLSAGSGSARPADIQELVQRVVHSQLVPSAVELDRPGSGATTLSLLLEGIPPGVEARAAQARDLLGADAVASDNPPHWWGAEPTSGAEVLLKVTHEIAGLASLLTALDEVSAAIGLTAHLRGSVAVGSVTVTLADVAGAGTTKDVQRASDGIGARGANGARGIDGAAARSDTASAVARFVDALRERASSFGGAVVVLEAPADLKADLDVWGPVRGHGLMRAVKDQFDPQRRLAPGRFVGGI
jgi:glycolate oxidase FAD binding subunit